MLIDQLAALADQHDQYLTHFLVKTDITSSDISGAARISCNAIVKDTLIAVIGGLLVDKRDAMLAMPIGMGLYIHQINDKRKGTINHSCDPNCRIQGFNQLVARRNINAGDELTIDYGTVSIGNGNVIIDKCNCKSADCRGTISTDDWKKLNTADLCLYGQHMREIL